MHKSEPGEGAGQPLSDDTLTEDEIEDGVEDGAEEAVFAYRVSKDGKVFLSWHGKQVMILKGREAHKFLARIGQTDEAGAQLVMAKVTGNFKRGNERPQGKRA